MDFGVNSITDLSKMLLQYAIFNGLYILLLSAAISDNL